MPLLRSLLIRAAKQIATDPRVQAKAVEIIRTEVQPRAEAAWQSARPKLASARAELAKITRESDPLRDPKGFARKLRERLARPEEEED